MHSLNAQLAVENYAAAVIEREKFAAKLKKMKTSGARHAKYTQLRALRQMAKTMRRRLAKEMQANGSVSTVGITADVARAARRKAAKAR